MKVFASAALIYMLFYLVIGIGWCLNIVHIIQAFNDPITALTIARFVGVFVFPIGAFLGLFF
jgi:hypothetical protein